jgi:chromosome segregation ATPase
VHDSLQDEHAKAVADYTQSESEASHLRAEFVNVENELEQLRRRAETRNQERDDLSRSVDQHRANAGTLHQQVQELQNHVSDLTNAAQTSSGEHAALSSQLAEANSAREAADTKHAAVAQDLASLESEVVRLTTELTMAKAELDGAYGSRAERAKEAQASEIDSLTDAHATALQDLATARSAHEKLETELRDVKASSYDAARAEVLEKELTALTANFQDLAHESLHLERERTQLDNLIDGLRDRVETLEGQISDERVRWLGMKSPATAAGGDRGVRESTGSREGVSVGVMRQEFKKMMREARAEGVRLLRVSFCLHFVQLSSWSIVLTHYRPSKKNVADWKSNCDSTSTFATGMAEPCLLVLACRMA